MFDTLFSVHGRHSTVVVVKTHPHLPNQFYPCCLRNWIPHKPFLTRSPAQGSFTLSHCFRNKRYTRWTSTSGWSSILALSWHFNCRQVSTQMQRKFLTSFQENHQKKMWIDTHFHPLPLCNDSELLPRDGGANAAVGAPLNTCKRRGCHKIEWAPVKHWTVEKKTWWKYGVYVWFMCHYNTQMSSSASVSRFFSGAEVPVDV